jgi:acetoin utilization deacetylase AcuC-like enzyme
LVDKVKATSIANEKVTLGSGIGGGFTHTQEVIPMKYKEAMAGPEKDEWLKAGEDEYQRMVKYKVFKEVHKTDLPKDAKILSSTWAMKKKANGTKRARINARSYEQVDGEHYNTSSIASPVVNEASMFLIRIIICMARMATDVNDVKGEFLNGKFQM